MSEKIVYPCLGHETYDDYVACDCNFASSHECWQYQQKKIDQLKAQLEKMKNCENCKHRTVKFIAVACRLTDSTDMPDYVCDKWKMMK